ncbi:hypothetical protein [Bartonella sp. LJL80]
MSKETAPLYLIKKGNGLLPASEMDMRILDAIHDGETVETRIKNRRNGGRLRAYWKMLHEVVKATECAPSIEALHQIVKLETGHTTDVLLRGYKVKIPASISFDKMTEPEMIDYFEHAKRFLAEAYGYVQEKAA